MRPVRFGPCLLAPLLLALAGCGGGPASVTGKVAHQGKPLVFGTVIVQGSDGVPMTGMILPDGTYAVEGVASGKVKIGVVSRDPGRGAYRPGQAGRRDKEPAADAKPPPPELGKWFPVPEKYEDPEKSGLTTTLRGGANTYNIELP